MINKVKENWRQLLVLATVVWGVIVFANIYGRISNYEYALTFGPFVTAMAIFFLFPKHKNQ